MDTQEETTIEIQTYDEMLKSLSYFQFHKWITNEQFEYIYNQIIVKRNFKPDTTKFKWRPVQ